VISLFWRLSAQARNWREQLSAKALIGRISLISGPNPLSPSINKSIDRTSPAQPARIIEKGDELLGGPALKAFRDIVGNGNGGPLDLIAQAIPSAKDPLIGELIYGPPKLDGVFPDGQIFESLVSHGGIMPPSGIISNLKSQISNR
jgi:hypothetical protein